MDIPFPGKLTLQDVARDVVKAWHEYLATPGYFPAWDSFRQQMALLEHWVISQDTGDMLAKEGKKFSTNGVYDPVHTKMFFGDQEQVQP